MKYSQYVAAGVNPALASALCVKARPDAYTLGERELVRMLSCARNDDVSARGLDIDANHDQEYVGVVKNTRVSAPYGDRYVDLMPCLTLEQRMRASDTATYMEQMFINAKARKEVQV